MNKTRTAGIGLALLLAAHAPMLHAQSFAPHLADGEGILIVIAQTVESHETIPPETLAQSLAFGNRLLEEGRYEEAAQRFGAAAARAVALGSHPDLTYALYREGVAHRRIYNVSLRVEYLRAAIAIWEQERTLYKLYGYPAGFRALAGFEVSEAYLALARHEDVLENTRRALTTLSESLATFHEAVPSFQAALRPIAPASAEPR